MTAVFSLFDKVAGEYGPLFEAPSDGVAFRNFASFFKDDDSFIDDFSLFKFGTFDCVTGVLQVLNPPFDVTPVNIKDLVRRMRSSSSQAQATTTPLR